jgi:phosphohistidine phosphatase
VKTLLLLRHAKSSWDEPTVADFDRPLAARGRRDAPRLGRFLGSSGVVPDFVLCSTAKRARETWKLVAKAAKYDGRVDYADQVYEATTERLVRLVRSLPAEAETAMLVGHNPGFEDLIHMLCTPDGRMGLLVPTGTLACVELGVDRWETVGGGAGSLRWLVVPRILGD